MYVKSCNDINYLQSEYNLDFIKNPVCGCRSIDSIYLDEIEVGISLLINRADENKFIVVLFLNEAEKPLGFTWYSHLEEFKKWSFRDVLETETEELKFLDEFLLFAESITDKNVVYNKRRERASDRYKLI